MDKTSLLASAQRQMIRAMSAWCTSDNDMAVLHGGIATEHLLKALLAARHPSLLVDGRDFNSLLHATGQSTYAASPETKVKTIGALDAFKRAAALITMPVKERDLDPLLTARNGVAHLGAHDDAVTHDALAITVTVADAVLTDLQEDIPTFWGPWADTRLDLEQMQRDAQIAAEQALKGGGVEAADEPQIENWEDGLLEPMIEDFRSKSFQAAQIAVAVKVRCAKKLYRVLYYGKTPGEIAKADMVEPEADRSEYGECLYRSVKCPVCGADGDVQASLGNQPKRPKKGRRARQSREFPDYFDCYTCGLELDNRYELEVLGLAEPSQNGWFVY
ncbi:hypothetical protein OG883_31895 [Streptomyces sp. NBC_01142]|uniref:hypothetical protein n=1 Tax=Streptomyces sp. NBC_01142 TaxID=2975865 RepID=UPI00224DE4CE|nr:hypothetical protein [Streptomyces sp. NBC_01142]MCX4824378.1 hypothetical protein [Streptomyces sp. NBC_01142]